jgi:hypothetical protein
MPSCGWGAKRGKKFFLLSPGGRVGGLGALAGITGLDRLGGGMGRKPGTMSDGIQNSVHGAAFVAGPRAERAGGRGIADGTLAMAGDTPAVSGNEQRRQAGALQTQAAKAGLGSGLGPGIGCPIVGSGDWVFERAVILDRICHEISKAKSRGLCRMIAGLAKKWDGRRFRSDPSRQLKLSKGSLQREYYRWRLNPGLEVFRLRGYRPGLKPVPDGLVIEYLRRCGKLGVMMAREAYASLKHDWEVGARICGLGPREWWDRYLDRRKVVPVKFPAAASSLYRLLPREARQAIRELHRARLAADRAGRLVGVREGRLHALVIRLGKEGLAIRRAGPPGRGMRN